MTLSLVLPSVNQEGKDLPFDVTATASLSDFFEFPQTIQVWYEKIF